MSFVNSIGSSVKQKWQQFQSDRQLAIKLIALHILGGLALAFGVAMGAPLLGAFSLLAFATVGSIALIFFHNSPSRLGS